MLRQNDLEFAILRLNMKIIATTNVRECCVHTFSFKPPCLNSLTTTLSDLYLKYWQSFAIINDLYLNKAQEKAFWV